MKDQLYLAALLHHIDVLKTEFNAIKTDAMQVYLDKADQYATASSSFEKGHLKRVASPFETLKKVTHDNQRKFEYGYQELNLNTRFFPSTKPEDKSSITELWQSFKKKYNSLTQQGKAKAETTLHLLHKYAVTIPNPTNIHPEVSFYDYTKIKAGLAVCLHEYLNEKKQNGFIDYKIKNTDEPLLIIRADISGIQEFIGSIASKNASKSLKGRSFYVQLLVDTVLKLMLKALKLYEGNVMYASGGNFFVIAPNTEFVRKQFKELEKDIIQKIFNEHKTRIAVVMGCKAVTQAQIFNDEKDKNGYIHGIEKAIKELFEDVIDKKKKQKFKTIIEKGYSQFFEPSDIGGEVATDAITGEEITKEEEKNNKVYHVEGALPEIATKEQIEARENLIRKTTADQIFLGFHLKKLDDLVHTKSSLDFDFYSKNEKDIKANYEFNPCNLGVFYYPVTEISYHEIKKILDNRVDVFNVVSINSKNEQTKEISETSFKNETEGLNTFMLYGGNQTPTFEIPYKEDVFDEKTQTTKTKKYKEGKPKEFSHLAMTFKRDKENNYIEKDNYYETERFKRLAVLKMDVDGLGSIFKTYVPYPSYHELKDTINQSEKNGQRRQNLSFTYYTALSRNLDWFFKGYLNTIWETEHFGERNKQEQLKHYSQIIYSGGDDLFIIGRWDAIIHFANKIQTDFSQFTLNKQNPNKQNQLPWQEKVTISGGMSIVTDKFPVMKAADFAGNAEHKAKDHKFYKTETPTQYNEVIFKKNSIDLLGISLNWEYEYKRVEQLKQQLVNRVGDSKDDISKSILSKIQIHAANARAYKEAKKKYNELSEKDKRSIIAPSPRYIWTAMYDLSRMEQRVKDKDNKDFIQDLREAIFTNKWNGKNIKDTSEYEFLTLLGIAARWAELTIRNKN